MKKARKKIIFVAWVFILLMAATVCAEQTGDPDKTLSPYFFVRSDDPTVDQLPLKSTSAVVNIAGVIADVNVTQVYKNEGDRPIEAIYIFPASTRAAVYAMKMTIGKRTIHAKIQKRDEARKAYEQAKQQGKSASLLEQQRPNVFRMNVANIMPGDIIKVALSYTELLIPSDKVYEFVYPTVVGPRYSNQPADTTPASEKWVENPFLHQGESPTYSFDIKVNISAGLPIRDITSTSHKVDVAYDGKSHAVVLLNEVEHNGGNRDYILKYRLAGKKIESGMLLYKGEKENFFLLMLQPPKRVKTSHIPPREYIFIVDVSGSMHGFPLDISKSLLRDLIGNLRPTDTFNVLLFAGGSTVMSERSLPATGANIRSAIKTIENQRGGGGTELLPALKRALAFPKTEGYSRTVVIVTDGYVTVEKEAFDLIRTRLGDANMFPFGIGSSVNRHIIEGMARVGMGEPFVVTRPEEAKASAEGFREMIQSPVLTSIEVDYRRFDVYDVEPLSIPDVLADRPVLVFGKWRGRPKGNITLRGITGRGIYTSKVHVRNVKPLKSNAALRSLWARYRIAILADYNRLSPDDERIREVTNLGLTYNLLTEYTSFVAIDTVIRNKDGTIEMVKQPLPLPEGVSDYAVGRYNSAPAAAPASPGKSGMFRSRSLVHAEVKEAKDEIAAEPEEQPARVNVGTITVPKGISPDEIDRILQKKREKIERCYKKALQQHPTMQGKLVIQLVLLANGKIEKIKTVSSELKNKRGEQCILQTIKKLRFPRPQDGKKATLTVTLHFKK